MLMAKSDEASNTRVTQAQITSYQANPNPSMIRQKYIAPCPDLP